MAYLNDNYSDSFKPVGLEFKSWAYDYDTITFKSKKYNNQSLHVYRKKADGKYTFSDDYFKLQMNDEANQYFENLAKPILGDVVTKVSFENHERPAKLGNYSSFSDYLKEGDILLELYVFSPNISEATSKDQYEAFVNELIKNKISLPVYFIKVNSNSESVVESSSLEDLLDSASDLFLERKGYDIKTDFSIEEYKLRKYSSGGDS